MSPKLHLDANTQVPIEPIEELREKADKILKKLDAIRDEVEEMRNLL